MTAHKLLTVLILEIDGPAQAFVNLAIHVYSKHIAKKAKPLILESVVLGFCTR